MDRRLHHHAAEQVAAPRATHRLHALIAHSEHPARLGLGRNLQHHLSIERRHLDAATESCGRETDGHLTAQVHSIALEDRVLAYLHLDIQITRRSAVAPGLALAGETHAIAAIDAGRNLHLQLLAAADAPLTETLIAGIAHDAAGAAAMRAGLLQREEALRDAHLTGAAAGVAGARRSAARRATAVAGLAFDQL